MGAKRGFGEIVALFLQSAGGCDLGGLLRDYSWTTPGVGRSCDWFVDSACFSWCWRIAWAVFPRSQAFPGDPLVKKVPVAGEKVLDCDVLRC